MQFIKNNIRLRKINFDDTDLIIKWRNSKSVKENLFAQENLTVEQHAMWMKNNIETNKCFQFIIEIKDSNTPIGTTFIKNIDKLNNKGEFGIFIGENNNRGHGYGTIATHLTLDFGFNELKLNRIYLSVINVNKSAIKCYENTGFKIDGIMREDYKREESYYDIVVMSILKNDYM